MRKSHPGFFGHLLLLWQLRIRASLNSTKMRGVPPIIAFFPALAPGFLLSILAYLLTTHPLVANDPVVSRFFLGLLCFVASLVWIVWPVLSAGVDDHSEAIRYLPFPISQSRLLVASTIASLFEPIAFVVHGPILGALFGHIKIHGFSIFPLSFLLFISFLLMCAF